MGQPLHKTIQYVQHLCAHSYSLHASSFNRYIFKTVTPVKLLTFVDFFFFFFNLTFVKINLYPLPWEMRWANQQRKSCYSYVTFVLLALALGLCVSLNVLVSVETVSEGYYILYILCNIIYII